LQSSRFITHRNDNLRQRNTISSVDSIFRRAVATNVEDDAPLRNGSGCNGFRSLGLKPETLFLSRFSAQDVGIHDFPQEIVCAPSLSTFSSRQRYRCQSRVRHPIPITVKNRSRKKKTRSRHCAPSLRRLISPTGCLGRTHGCRWNRDKLCACMSASVEMSALVDLQGLNAIFS
jgi:hypothetical protein